LQLHLLPKLWPPWLFTWFVSPPSRPPPLHSISWLITMPTIAHYSCFPFQSQQTMHLKIFPFSGQRFFCCRPATSLHSGLFIHLPICFSYLHGEMRNPRAAQPKKRSENLGERTKKYEEQGNLAKTHLNKFNKNK